MGKLMNRDTSMQNLLLLSDSLLIYQHSVSETDHANILHATNSELRYVDLIIFRVGKLRLEKVFVETNTFVYDAELLICINICKLACSAKDSHGHFRL